MIYCACDHYSIKDLKLNHVSKSDPRLILNNAFPRCSQLLQTCHGYKKVFSHYNDVIMSEMASQITSLTIVYTDIYENVPIWWRHHGTNRHRWCLKMESGWTIQPLHFAMLCICVLLDQYRGARPMTTIGYMVMNIYTVIFLQNMVIYTHIIVENRTA